MPKPSIDYLNSRRANAPAGGGTNYARRDAERQRRYGAVDARAADVGKDSLDRAHDVILATFAEFRSFVRESDNRVAALLFSGVNLNSDEPIPF